MEKEMFSKFSERTQRFRFFQLIKDISHEQLIRYTQIDYDREIAIICEIEENERKMMAGVVRLIADQYNETAEFAIVIADPWQGLGLGNKFMDYLCEIAKSKGIQRIYANILPVYVLSSVKPQTKASTRSGDLLPVVSFFFDLSPSKVIISFSSKGKFP